jgi:hypothetical protein
MAIAVVLVPASDKARQIFVETEHWFSQSELELLCRANLRPFDRRQPMKLFAALEVISAGQKVPTEYLLAATQVPGQGSEA